VKHCFKCNQEKPFEAFYSSNTHKSGYASWCIVCEAERCKTKNIANRERRLAKAKEWRENHPETARNAIIAWREANKERYTNYFVQYSKANRGKVNTKWMKREAAKKSRTPAWLTDDDYWMIEQAYDIANKRTQMLGVQFHVDHIVPLQGKTVSGLHVPWNLQVITAKENRMKSNKITSLTERISALEAK
jgi:DNA polymerase III delta prime subunit